MNRRKISTKTALAARMGCSLQDLNHYLKGRRSPSAGVIDKLCAALLTQPGEFLYYIEDANDPEPSLAA